MEREQVKHKPPWGFSPSRKDVVLVLVALLVVTQLVFRPNLPHPLVGREAPVFTLKDHHGRWVTGPDGGWTLMHFQPEACLTCHANRRVLDAVQRNHGSAVKVVTLVAEGFKRVEHADHLQVVDPGARVARRYGVSGQPTTVLVGGDGEVVWVHRGAFTSLKAREVVARLKQVR